MTGYLHQALALRILARERAIALRDEDVAVDDFIRILRMTRPLTRKVARV